MEPDSQNIPQSKTPAWVQEVIQKIQQVVERQDT